MKTKTHTEIAKENVKGCEIRRFKGGDGETIGSCGENKYFCFICRKVNTQHATDCQRFLEVLDDKLKKLRKMNCMFNCECGITTDKYMNTVELFFVPIIADLQNALKVYQEESLK